ncbi:PREDICTED: olfactory receptor 1009-like [Nanorana parkeri]|uniref:olfactory receptor 1009-like n=1 Tax=Nanorana parkeri TaxID=125878 RepID=UPI0008541192|nr:PREDICTED: olfactory receptor 1009-like [Nanorana parkeri]
MWLGIMDDIYRMEDLTASLRNEEERFRSTWMPWLHFRHSAAYEAETGEIPATQSSNGIADNRLHKPMYLFLSNLSFVDVICSSVIVPKMLRDLLSETKAISFVGCAVQLFIFGSFASTESLLLGVMAYDRYVAICSPLLYHVHMSGVLCLQMLVAAYFGGFLNSLVQTVAAFRLNFCRSNIIKHFFCDLPPLYKLSCSDISMNIAALITLGSLVSMSSIILIIVSYTNIVLAVLNVRSARGRYKAFSTCTSHITAVSVFYGTVFFMYFRPSTSILDQDWVASVFYSVGIPMLNPLIYSLRNAEVIEALKSFWKCFK